MRCCQAATTRKSLPPKSPQSQQLQRQFLSRKRMWWRLNSYCDDSNLERAGCVFTTTENILNHRSMDNKSWDKTSIKMTKSENLWVKRQFAWFNMCADVKPPQGNLQTNTFCPQVLKRKLSTNRQPSSSSHNSSRGDFGVGAVEQFRKSIFSFELKFVVVGWVDVRQGRYDKVVD